MEKNAKKILIVEDEKPISRAMELKLTHAGFAVKTAYDGEEALKIIEGETFDMILLDLILPKKDGFAVLTELNTKNIKTPVIVLSNLSQAEDVDRAKKMGAADYFIKSNTPISSIVEYINKILTV
jgi:DNA-binding response OmpR family regulator